MSDEETVAREASVLFPGAKRDPACTCPKFLCRGDDGVLRWKPYATAKSCLVHSDREGPRLRIEASCHGCVHECSAHYACQGDSGCVVSCAHPDGKGRIGDTTWKTPRWCPLYEAALARLLDEVKR